MTKRERLGKVREELQRLYVDTGIRAVLEQEAERLEREMAVEECATSRTCALGSCSCMKLLTCRQLSQCPCDCTCHRQPPPKPEPYPIRKILVKDSTGWCVEYDAFVLKPEHSDRSRWPQWAREYEKTWAAKFPLNGDIFVQGRAGEVVYLRKNHFVALFGEP
jgi:hypothetical protein